MHLAVNPNAHGSTQSHRFFAESSRHCTTFQARIVTHLPQPSVRYLSHPQMTIHPCKHVLGHLPCPSTPPPHTHNTLLPLSGCFVANLVSPITSPPPPLPSRLVANLAHSMSPPVLLLYPSVPLPGHVVGNLAHPNVFPLPHTIPPLPVPGYERGGETIKYVDQV
jgi:hypothetical protein